MSHVPERILKKMRESIPERPQIQLVDDLNFPEPPKRNSSASTSATSRTPKRKPTGQLTATSNKTKRLSGNKPQPTQQPTPRLNNPRVRQVARVAKQAPTQVPNQVKPPKLSPPPVPTVLHPSTIVHYDQYHWRELLLTEHSKANPSRQRRKGV